MVAGVSVLGIGAGMCGKAVRDADRTRLDAVYLGSPPGSESSPRPRSGSEDGTTGCVRERLPCWPASSGSRWHRDPPGASAQSERLGVTNAAHAGPASSTRTAMAGCRGNGHISAGSRDTTAPTDPLVSRTRPASDSRVVSTQVVQGGREVWPGPGPRMLRRVRPRCGLPTGRIRRTANHPPGPCSSRVGWDRPCAQAASRAFSGSSM